MPQLQFPTTGSFGWLSIRDAGSQRKWEKIGSARGVIDVPPGKEIRLWAGEDLSPLSAPVGQQISCLGLAEKTPATEMVHLRDLPTLRELWANGVRGIGDGGIAYLSGLTGLRQLHINYTGITDNQMSALAGLREVEVLNVSTNGRIGDGALAAIGEITALRDLNMQSTGVTGSGFPRLSKLQSLQKLELGYTRLTEESLAGLAALSALEWLDVSANKHSLGSAKPVDGTGLAPLRVLKRLRALNLHGTDCDDDGMAAVATLTSLRQLSVGITRVTDAGLEHLRGLTKLRTLDLACCPITDAGLVHLRALADLESLDIAFCPITGAGLAHLYEHKRLRRLDCRGVSDEYIQALRLALPNCVVN